MTGARARRSAHGRTGVAALAAVLMSTALARADDAPAATPPGPARADDAPTGDAAPPVVAPTGDAAPPVVVAAPTAKRPETYPFVLLFQGDAVVDSTPNETGAALDNDPARGSHVRLRRLRFGDDVVQGAWRARVLIEASSRDEVFAPVEGGRIPSARYLRVTEAFGSFRPHRALEVTVGAQRVPFSLSRQVDALDLRLPERPQVVLALAPDYRTGVALTSDLGLLDLRIAGMSADRSFDGELLTSGYFGAVRLGANPIGPMGDTPWLRPPSDPWYDWWRFSAGVSVLYGTLLAPRTLGFGGDAQLQWRRVTVTGEYLGQHLPDAGWAYQGADVEPGVFLVERRFELVLRGAWYRQPSNQPSTLPTTATMVPGETDTLAGGGALTFFAREGHVRVQAGLELRHPLDAHVPDSGWGIIRLSLAL